MPYSAGNTVSSIQETAFSECFQNVIITFPALCWKKILSNDQISKAGDQSEPCWRSTSSKLSLLLSYLNLAVVPPLLSYHICLRREVMLKSPTPTIWRPSATTIGLIQIR